MARVGTLLAKTSPKPVGPVLIERRGREVSKIRVWDPKLRGWSRRTETVDTNRVLDDKGAGWEAHSRNPRQATWLSLWGEPQGLLRLGHVYRTVAKAKLYLGDGKWSREQDFEIRGVRFDGGAGWGYNPPAGDDAEPDETTAANTAQKPAPAATERRGVCGQRVGYVRVSSVDQNPARQLEALGECDRIFTEHMSGRTRAPRVALAECTAYLRDGDELVVASIDRLARSMLDLRALVDELTDKGVSVAFVHERLTFAPEGHDPRADLLLGILGSFAEFERAIIRERQAEGIALAKKAGKYRGRKRALTPETTARARQLLAEGVSKAETARRLGIGRTTLYRLLADDNQEAER